MSRSARALTVAALIVVGAVGAAQGAWAHASLESSDPAPGSTLSEPPETLTLTFTEAPDVDLTTVELLDVAGSTIATGPVRLTGSRVVQVEVVDPLPEGAYTISWRVVSTADGHVTAGTIAFGLGVAPTGGTTAPGEEVEDPTAWSVVSKACLYAGLMLLLAIAIVGMGAFGGRPRSLRVVAMVAAVLSLAGAAGLLVTEQRAVGVPMADLLASETGRPLLWLALAVLAADALAVIGAAKSAWRPILWGAGAAAAAAMWLRATGGHAAAAIPQFPQELLQWAHMVSAGLWVGGVVLLWLLLREPANEEGPPIREVGRYSALAFVAVAVVVLTGLLRAAEELGGPGEVGRLLDTSYGQVLALKILGVLALIGMGAANRRRSIPLLATDPRPLRRVVAAECLVALGVVLLTATLTGLAPGASADGTDLPATPPPVTAEGTDFATTTRVELTLAPGAPGPSTIEAHVTDPDGGGVLTVDEVTLRVRSVTHPDVPAVTVPLAAQGEAWATTTSAISLAGTWTVTAVVRDGSEAIEVPLVLTTRLPDATSTVEVGPGVPTVTTTTFADGTSLQTYVDPSTPGPNQIHATAFARDGGEMPFDEVAIVAIPAEGAPRRLNVLEAGTGHVAANADLEAGGWTFDVVATTEDGAVMQATFDATVEAP